MSLFDSEAIIDALTKGDYTKVCGPPVFPPPDAEKPQAASLHSEGVLQSIAAAQARISQYDDPKPTNHHNEFDNLMGVLLANVSVKYPHTLPLVKDALHKIMLHTYNGLRQEIQAINVNNENKAARLSLGLLRQRLRQWRMVVKNLEAREI